MRWYSLISSLFLCSLLSACGLTSPVKLPQQSSYAITGPELGMSKQSRTQKTLLVSLPIASSGYQTTKMVYVETPYKLNAFANNRWVAPPSEMLLPLLAERIRSVGYFKAVVTPPFSGMTNYRLDTQLLVLQQEFMRPTSLVRFVMQVTLINNASSQVIASRRFQVMVSSPENNPYSGVLAANKAADVMSQRITQFVTDSL